MNSNWVGLGGFNTGTLVQDGTAVGEENVGVASHQAWYELINGPFDRFVPLPVSATAGQKFTAETFHVQGAYDLFVKNEFTGAKFFTAVSFSPFDGSTAENITELPEGGLSAGIGLEKFDPFTVVDAEASRDGVNFRGVASFDHDDIIMFDHNHHEMAFAGSANSGGNSWVFNWVNCS